MRFFQTKMLVNSRMVQTEIMLRNLQLRNLIQKSRISYGFSLTQFLRLAFLGDVPFNIKLILKLILLAFT